MKIGDYYYANRTAEEIMTFPKVGGVYQFIGPKGLGKSYAAQEVSKMVLNTDNIRNHPDFFYLLQENAIGMEEITAFEEFSKTLPAKEKIKVAVIDNADTMTVSAQNAILKLLEEGTVYMMVILICHGKMIPTVESRAKKIHFFPIAEDEEREILKNLYGDEVNPLALRLSAGKIGFYDFIIKEKAYLDTVEKTLICLAEGKKEKIFEILNLMKEKDKENFFEMYDVEQVRAYIRFLRDVFFKVLLNISGICLEESPSCDIAAISEHYSILMVQAIVSYIDKADGLLKGGRFSKNDWFDLIRFIAE